MKKLLMICLLAATFVAAQGRAEAGPAHFPLPAENPNPEEVGSLLVDLGYASFKAFSPSTANPCYAIEINTPYFKMEEALIKNLVSKLEFEVGVQRCGFDGLVEAKLDVIGSRSARLILQSDQKEIRNPRATVRIYSLSGESLSTVFRETFNDMMSADLVYYNQCPTPQQSQ